MMAGRIFDISQTLSPALPVWPGDTEFSSEVHWTLEAECPVNVSLFRLSTHSGSHADAPLHYDPDGSPIADVELLPYVGPAYVADLRGRGDLITAEMMEPILDLAPERILFRTFDHFPHDRWTSQFTAVCADAIRLMASRGVILVGTDAPSIDPQDSKSLAAHHAVKVARMRILEGLVLDDVEAGFYELIAPPLKLAGLDASPVRALLRELPK